MKRLILEIVCVAFLAGCSSPPKAPQPTGDWTPVNTPTASKE